MAEEEPSPATKSRRPLGTTAASSRPSVRRPEAMGAERARRRDMSRLYAELGALLPGLPPRAKRARILEEAIACVRALRGAAAELEAHSRALAAGQRHAAAAASAGAVEVVASGEASCFSVRTVEALRPGSLTRVLEVFHRHGVAVLAATVARNGGEAAVTVTTTAVAPGAVERIKADIIASIA
ncbi:hypothetical protein ACP70R_041053 [Stipagrostis hirtigluma subsp. patula]